MLPAGNVARAAMSQLHDNLFAAPTLPGTILVGVCAAYWLLMILGAVDLDLLDFDLDFDGADVDHGAGGLGMAALKFLIVVGWYMHLRYEKSTLSRFFTFGFVLACILYAIVLATFGVLAFEA